VRWEKLGQVFRPDPRVPWGSHAAMLPTPLLLPGGRIRIYCGFAAADGVSRIGWVDVDEQEPTRVSAISQTPSLDVGSEGCFDQDGVVPGCAVHVGDEIFLYYLGYERQVRVRFTIFTGLAVSRDGGTTFERLQRNPILDRTDDDLFIRSTPFVERDGTDWLLWYAGGGHWVTSPEGKPLAASSIRRMRSRDPARWPGSGQSVWVSTAPEQSQSVNRPWRLRGPDGDRLLFAERTGHSYRILSIVRAGQGWALEEVPPIEPSETGWDQGSVCYPACIETPGQTLLFYAGSNTGGSGFGVARLESPARGASGTPSAEGSEAGA
jgi:hypothetical protein